MNRFVLAIVLLATASATHAGTDFGERQAPSIRNLPLTLAPTRPESVKMPLPLAAGEALSMTRALVVAQRWGRVSSTLRSPAHNRAVGGVPNSFHLSGRAIDVVRGAGVRHHQIEAPSTQPACG